MSNLSQAIEMITRRCYAVDEAMSADAGFDGGEFSGPAHWRMYAHDADQLARRFGFVGVRDVYDRARHADRLDEDLHNILMAAIAEGDGGYAGIEEVQ